MLLLIVFLLTIGRGCLCNIVEGATDYSPVTCSANTSEEACNDANREEDDVRCTWKEWNSKDTSHNMCLDKCRAGEFNSSIVPIFDESESTGSESTSTKSTGTIINNRSDCIQLCKPGEKFGVNPDDGSLMCSACPKNEETGIPPCSPPTTKKPGGITISEGPCLNPF